MKYNFRMSFSDSLARFTGEGEGEGSR